MSEKENEITDKAMRKNTANREDIIAVLLALMAVYKMVSECIRNNCEYGKKENEKKLQT